MRKLTLILLIAMMFVFVGSAYAYDLSNVNQANNTLSTSKIDNKAPYNGPEYKPDPNVILQGGDTFFAATFIPFMPYSNTGTTVGYTNNYDAVCPYGGSTAPDVVYQYIAPVNMTVNITLCTNSAYDTKLYVHANSYVYGSEIACNDDACGTPSYPSAYVSQLLGVALTAGNAYYFTVDGYGADAGIYTIDISMDAPCNVICPGGGNYEGEPLCADNYDDHYNGGCNSTPNVFQPIACNEYMCGSSGAFMYQGLNYRDTDWFSLTLGTPQTLTWTAVADMPTLIYIMNGAGCPGTVIGSATGAACDTVTVSAAVPAGTYWLWIGPSVFGTGAPCPAYYVAWATCAAPQEPCVVTCPLGGIPEGEPDCYPGYFDNYNGGCYSLPPAFQPIASGDTICGTSGVFGPRDTDWYTIDVTENCDLSWCGKAEFGLLLFIMDAGSGDCLDYYILTYGTAEPCSTLCLSIAATPGTYWLWIGPSVWDPTWACPSDYVAWVNGCGTVPPTPCCDVNMVPIGSTNVCRGGTFHFTGSINNPTLAPIVTDIGWGVRYLNTIYWQGTVMNIPLAPGQTLSAPGAQSVPMFAPYGTYDFIAFCGNYPTTACDSAKFQFTVVQCLVEGGATEWTLEGGWNVLTDIPNEYALIGSYPNPFNATTSITYVMPAAGNVTLEVYNLMGQKVATLVNGHNEAGQHNVTWDAANYSSGIYFSRLTAGDQVFTKRMTLLK